MPMCLQCVWSFYNTNREVHFRVKFKRIFLATILNGNEVVTHRFDRHACNSLHKIHTKICYEVLFQIQIEQIRELSIL